MRLLRTKILPLLCLLLYGLNVMGQCPSSQRMQQWLSDKGFTFYEGNSIALFHHGGDKFVDVLAAIRQARHYVHAEYFYVSEDSIGNLFYDALERKAAEGVEVKLLIDALGNHNSEDPTSSRKLKELRSKGVEVHLIDRVRFPWVKRLFRRDHRKILVVDGLMCYAGGMNVADHYIVGKPSYGPWYDMQFRLEGPGVAEYEGVFRQMWQHVTQESLDSVLYAAPEGVRVESAFSDLKPDTTSDVRNKRVVVVNKNPGQSSSRNMREAMIAAFDAAEHHIQIVNPYPTNIREVRHALFRALNRGVRVEIMVSAHSDVRVTPDVVGMEMKRLMKRGAEVYYYENGFHHSKMMMVDDEWCTVGSANLDGRSLCFDYEVNAFVFSQETTDELIRIFEEDKRGCTLLTPEGWRQRFNLWHRFVGRFAGMAKYYF